MSVAAAELDRREGGGQQAQGRIRRALSQFQLMQEQNAGKKGSVEVRICTNAPRVSIVRSDNELLVTQYVPPLLGDSSFTFHLQNVPGGIFSQYLQHFEAVWNGAQAPNTVTD